MTTEQNGISRRSFLTTASALAVGAGIARLPGTAEAADALPTLPWTQYYPTAGLDVEAVREAAYCLNFGTPGGCGYAASQVLINALGDALALQIPAPDTNPWKLLPKGLYAFASGGMLGWGTICGSLSGVLGVMNMLGVHGTLGNALMDYFCSAELPTGELVGWDPPDAVWPGVPTPWSTVATVSHSPLCHNSVSNWAATAGVPLWVTKDGKTVPSPAKSNRCALLVADIVAKAVELMNDKFLRSMTPASWTVPASYKTCYDCHTKADTDPATFPSEIGRMECQACHTVPGGHGSWKRNKGPTR